MDFQNMYLIRQFKYLFDNLDIFGKIIRESIFFSTNSIIFFVLLLLLLLRMLLCMLLLVQLVYMLLNTCDIFHCVSRLVRQQLNNILYTHYTLYSTQFTVIS